MFQKPTVGSTVTVKTQYYMPSFHRENRYNTEEITGTILNDFKWLQPNQFVISNPRNPKGVSVVSLTHVIDLKDSAGKTATVKIDPEYRQWTVKGSKGNEYLVIRQKGLYNCTCTGFQYRKSCRHITEVGNE